jgi:maltose-binding protein MalE
VDFGGERTEKKITVSDLRQLENTYPGIWVVFADNDEVFFTKEARTYMENEYTLVDNIKIRGAAVVYHWQDTGK